MDLDYRFPQSFRDGTVLSRSRLGLLKIFLPHGMKGSEVDNFAKELQEDANKWTGLKEQLILVAEGTNVVKIVGDQKARAEFRYRMPNGGDLDITRCASFTCQNGDWRAEG